MLWLLLWSLLVWWRGEGGQRENPSAPGRFRNAGRSGAVRATPFSLEVGAVWGLVGVAAQRACSLAASGRHRTPASSGVSGVPPRLASYTSTSPKPTVLHTTPPAQRSAQNHVSWRSVRDAHQPARRAADAGATPPTCHTHHNLTRVLLPLSSVHAHPHLTGQSLINAAGATRASPLACMQQPHPPPQPCAAAAVCCTHTVTLALHLSPPTHAHQHHHPHKPPKVITCRRPFASRASARRARARPCPSAGSCSCTWGRCA